MAIQELSTVALHFKEQSGGLGSAESGSGGTKLLVTPSQGMQKQFAEIRNDLFETTRMAQAPRQGSYSASAAYETALVVGSADVPFEAILGGTWVAEASYSNTDWGDCTITDSGVTITFGSGTLITDGVRAGMMLKFTNLSVAGNNNVYVPIVSLTETVVTVPTGFLADNSADSAWDVVVAKNVSTADPYTKRYFTVEEYWTDLDQSKYGTDHVWSALNFQGQPDQNVRIGFQTFGREMVGKDTGDAPVLTSPTSVTGSPVVLLDGGVYLNGTKNVNVTGFNFSLAANPSTLPVVGTRLSPDVFLGTFRLSGQFSGGLEGLTNLTSLENETQLSVILHCAENTTDPKAFVTFYLGDLRYFNHQSGIGGDGPAIETLQLRGGRDVRGAASGYAPTSVLISASETTPA